MQAARGTSLSDIETPSGVRRSPRPWTLFAALAAALYVVDQVSKWQAEKHLEGRDDVSVIGDLLQLRLVYNPGAAFSLGTEYTVVLSCVAIVAAVAVVWFSRRLGSTLWAVALGFLLAGVCGNLTDRLLRDPGPLRGHVVDFLMLPNWPIFNVADICINVAAALILVQAFRGVRLDGTRTTDEETDA
ncbi:signal peptidase II [Nocardioides sp. W7]|uniref:signal peptidase II n=1 Tax=Nocardioides sp. W7 TaxID=2931390 RepID=UPI001FD5D9BE|nr:signal peptidase II [Nocardioides sp. W7]